MRSADDNLVPSDKDLEHLLRKAQKSAAKKEAYKKTTKQYYSSVANGIVREVFEDSSIDDHYLLLKCLMLRCAQDVGSAKRLWVTPVKATPLSLLVPLMVVILVG